MRTRRLLAAVVGSAMVLVFAGAALADIAVGTKLNQTGTAITPDATGCVGLPAGVTVNTGQSAWHFVSTAKTGTVQGHFAFSSGVQDGVDSIPQGDHQQWWIVTDSTVTLDGSNTWTNATGGEFVLSSSCTAGGPTPSPSPTPTPTLPPSDTLGSNPTQPAGTSLYLVFGLMLAVAGGLVAYAMRPRRSLR